MKRKLISQMRNEWRSNVWMMVELVIVGLVLWAVFMIMLSLKSFYNPYEGMDFNNLYVGNFGYVNDSKSTFRPYEEGRSWTDERDVLLNTLRSNKYVETVGIGTNALPYSFNYNGNLFLTTVDGNNEEYMGNERYMDPEAVKAIRLTGTNGESSEQLAQMLEQGNMFICNLDEETDSLHLDKWRGSDIYNSDSIIMHVGAIIPAIRRYEYEGLYEGRGAVVLPMKPGGWADVVIIRVLPGKGREFMESLTAESLEAGNVYISNMQSVDDMRETANQDISLLYRNTAVCAFFVLMAVFLAFLGAFWFRTGQRVPEIGLRKVNGATNGDIIRRFLAEGLLIMVIPMIFIAVAGYILADNINIIIEGLEPKGWLLWLSYGLMLVSIMLIIVIGIAIPARKAMKVNPAEALSDQ